MSFRIAVLGDSVAWGQGLLDNNKYTNIVAKRYRNSQPVELDMKSHSGAIIGAQYSGAQTRIYGEVPVYIPTIIHQVSEVEDPASVDLVLLNGGINDIGVDKILDPLTTSSLLQEVTTRYCYDDMKILLEQVVTVFTKPTCKFILTGYYPILSSHSRVFLADGILQLENLLSHHSLSIPVYLEKIPAINHVVANCMQFWKESDRLLNMVITETAAKFNIVKRMFFVKAPFGEANALFAEDPWIFGLNLTFEPEDEVIESRYAECSAVYPQDPNDLVQREICYRASVGHPNLNGAKALADAILKLL